MFVFTFKPDSEPSEWMKFAEQSWPEEIAVTSDVPARPITHPTWSIVGTMSFIGPTDVHRLRKKLGPVRSVTRRHTQRIVKWLEKIGWVRWGHRSRVGWVGWWMLH